VEIIVADAGSPDGTADEAEATKTRCAKSVVSTPPGRAQAHNAGAAAATGDIVFFLHADTVVPLGWDKLIRDCLRDPTVVMGAFAFGVDRSSFSAKNRWAGAPTGMGTVEAFANLRSRAFQLPYGDQGLFLLRSRWLQVGPMPGVVVMEDFEFVRAVRRQAVSEGRRIAVLPQPALCSGRRWEAHGVPYCTAANQAFVFAYSHLGFSDRDIYQLYYGKPAPVAEPVDGTTAEAVSPRASVGSSSPQSVGPVRIPTGLAGRLQGVWASPRSPLGPARLPAGLNGAGGRAYAAAAAEEPVVSDDAAAEEVADEAEEAGGSDAEAGDSGASHGSDAQSDEEGSPGSGGDEAEGREGDAASSGRGHGADGSAAVDESKEAEAATEPEAVVRKTDVAAAAGGAGASAGRGGKASGAKGKGTRGKRGKSSSGK